MPKDKRDVREIETWDYIGYITLITFVGTSKASSKLAPISKIDNRDLSWLEQDKQMCRYTTNCVKQTKA